MQGTKLWIIMEYLGGGSALDMVSIEFWWHTDTYIYLHLCMYNIHVYIDTVYK